jgi:4'-phosphopantetheinyl transferase EntD
MIVVAEGHVGPDRPDALFPEEAAQIARAVAARQAEFACGRTLARSALASLGMASVAIPAGPDRVPLWPAGFTGSIAHSRTRAAAAVARTCDAAAIGIDIESVARFHPGLDRHILTQSEAACLSRRPGPERGAARAVAFASKEAFYKCQYMLSRARLGFHDADVAIDFAAGSFTLTLLADAPPFAARDVFQGRFRLTDGMVGVAMWLPPR